MFRCVLLLLDNIMFRCVLLLLVNTYVQMYFALAE